MNRIPKCRSKYIEPSQDNNIKPTPRDSNKEHLVPKITQKNLKFDSNRQFGKDLTNSMKGNYYNIYNNHTIKVVTIDDKKSNNKVYIKKHSSASQTIQKAHKVKIETNGKKIRENNSNSMVNKKNSVLSPEYDYNKNNNNLDYPQQIDGSKLQSTISFGINNIRPFSSNNNSNSVRLSNPVNKMSNNLNSRRTNSNNENNNNNNNCSNEKPNNRKIVATHSNLDLM